MGEVEFWLSFGHKTRRGENAIGDVTTRTDQRAEKTKTSGGNGENQNCRRLSSVVISTRTPSSTKDLAKVETAIRSLCRTHAEFAVTGVKDVVLVTLGPCHHSDMDFSDRCTASNILTDAAGRSIDCDSFSKSDISFPCHVRCVFSRECIDLGTPYQRTDVPFGPFTIDQNMIA